MKNDIKKKKVLHVIHIVYDILSALFILFTSTVLIIYGATRSDEKTQDVLTPNIQEVEYKSRRDFIKTSSGFYEYGCSDIFSFDFITELIGYFTNNLNQPYFALTSSDTGQYVLQLSNVYKVYFYQDPVTEQYDLAINVSNIVFNKSLWYTNTYLYRLTFSNSSPYDRQVTFLWTTQRTADNAYQLTVIGCMLESVSQTLQNAFLPMEHWGGRFMLSEDASSRDAFIYDLMIQDNSLNYDKGYQQGYDKGYNDGYWGAWDGGIQANIDSAYQDGYGVGYNAGVADGADGIETNAFTVIGQAFDSVNSIFSINVLPGLPLWVLAFTPLIIAVVIVVVKMIKG